MRTLTLALSTFALCLVSGSAIAAPVMDGTVSSVALFNPTIKLNTDPATYAAMNGLTFEISGTGGFLPVGGKTGKLNGTLTFSKAVGTLIPESVSDFFVFSDGSGGTYNFSTLSVQTNSFINNTGVSTSGTLYVLGNIIDSNLNMLALTPASLTIQFNSTGGSPFSSSLTLAVPPSGVPEPATWAMMIAGFGMVGAAMRGQRVAKTRFNFA